MECQSAGIAARLSRRHTFEEMEEKRRDNEGCLAPLALVRRGLSDREGVHKRLALEYKGYLQAEWELDEAVWAERLREENENESRG